MAMSRRRLAPKLMVMMTIVREADGGRSMRGYYQGLGRRTAYAKCAQQEWKCGVKANRTRTPGGGKQPSRPRSTAPEDTPSFAVPPQTPARGSHARRQSPRSINNLLRAIVTSATRTNPAFRAQSLTSVLFITTHNALGHLLKSRILN